MTACGRDYQQGRVYSAELMLRRLLDHPGTQSSVSGVSLMLEPEDRLPTLAVAQMFVDRVVAHPAVVARFGPSRRVPMAETPRKGVLAYYSSLTQRITVNAANPDESMRETVLLHELAHHYCGTRHGHGPLFAETVQFLVETIIGPQAGLALRLLYASARAETVSA